MLLSTADRAGYRPLLASERGRVAANEMSAKDRFCRPFSVAQLYNLDQSRHANVIRSQ
jgi:hypothetical protein